MSNYKYIDGTTIKANNSRDFLNKLINRWATGDVVAVFSSILEVYGVDVPEGTLTHDDIIDLMVANDMLTITPIK